MKFGKKIVRAAASSTALCAESLWLDYKQLKRLLKPFETSHADGATTAQPVSIAVKNDAPPAHPQRVSPARQRAVSAHDLSNCDDERAFFSFLRSELAKVTATFADLERLALARFLDITRAIDQENARLRCDPASRGPVTEPTEALLARLAAVHRHLVLLRNFAVLNYCGFTKILKKHDKVTGFRTRDKYMLRVVSEQPFAEHATLKRALEMLGSEYVALRDAALGTAVASSSRASVDEEKTGVPARTDSRKRALRETAPALIHDPPPPELDDDDDDDDDDKPRARAGSPDVAQETQTGQQQQQVQEGPRPRKRARASSHMNMPPTSSEDPLFSLMHAAEMHARIGMHQQQQQEPHMA